MIHRLLRTEILITFITVFSCMTSGCSNDSSTSNDDLTEKIDELLKINLLATSPENGGQIPVTGELRMVFDSAPKSVTVNRQPAILQDNTATVKIADLPNVIPGTENTVIVEWRTPDNSLAGAQTITFTVLEPVADPPQLDDSGGEALVGEINDPPPQPNNSGGEALQIEVDHAAEEAAIIEVFTLNAEAIGTKDPDAFMPYWLKSEREDVFVAWDFWAGAFEKHLGWEEIKQGWEGIFRLRNGKMTVEIESVAIDKDAKNATLRGRYQWAVNGSLIASMVKGDRKDGWKIKQIDYTNGKFGKQVDELKDPAYMNPPRGGK